MLAWERMRLHGRNMYNGQCHSQANGHRIRLIGRHKRVAHSHTVSHRMRFARLHSRIKMPSTHWLLIMGRDVMRLPDKEEKQCHSQADVNKL